MRLPRPAQIGWEAVKANAVPMVALWMVAAALVFGYYLVPGPVGTGPGPVGVVVLVGNVAILAGY